MTEGAGKQIESREGDDDDDDASPAQLIRREREMDGAEGGGEEMSAQLLWLPERG